MVRFSLEMYIQTVINYRQCQLAARVYTSLIRTLSLSCAALSTYFYEVHLTGTWELALGGQYEVT